MWTRILYDQTALASSAEPHRGITRERQRAVLGFLFVELVFRTRFGPYGHGLSQAGVSRRDIGLHTVNVLAVALMGPVVSLRINELCQRLSLSRDLTHD